LLSDCIVTGLQCAGRTKRWHYFDVTFKAGWCRHFCREKQYYYINWVCVCSFRYPVRNAHALYCHLWSVRLHNIFPHYFTNGTIFGETLLNRKCVFWFSPQPLSKTFLTLRKTGRNTFINVYRSSCKVTAMLVRL
jgi:hypothetical protein